MKDGLPSNPEFIQLTILDVSCLIICFVRATARPSSTNSLN